jgi:N4-gp56 family major capsid protein
MANNTQTTLANAIKTQYEKRLLTRALPRLVHGRWGLRARLNKTGAYELRKYGALSAITSALTEGTTPAEQSAISLTLVTLTPSFYGAWLGHTDELEMTVFDPIISEFSSILGEQAGLSADTLVRNSLTENATKDYAGSATSRATVDYPAHVPTYADFIKQVASLEAENAMPVDGDDFICIMHSFTWASLMQDPTFVNLFIHASGEGDSNPLRSGYVGRILRCKIFVSSNAREYADGGVGSTTDVYSMLFIAREAYGNVGISGNMPNLDVDSAPAQKVDGMTGQNVKPVEIIVKQLGSAGADDPLNQRSTIGWKMSLATTVTNAAWIRDLEHANVASDD